MRQADAMIADKVTLRNYPSEYIDGPPDRTIWGRLSF